MSIDSASGGFSIDFQKRIASSSDSRQLQVKLRISHAIFLPHRNQKRFQKPMTAGRFILIVGLLAVAFAGGWLSGAQNPDAFTSQTEEQPIESPEKIARVVAQGKLVPTNGIHNVRCRSGAKNRDCVGQ